MQILSSKGYEFEICDGFDWIPGTVKKIKNKKLPHIGWNNINLKNNSPLLKNIWIRIKIFILLTVINLFLEMMKI